LTTKGGHPPPFPEQLTEQPHLGGTTMITTLSHVAIRVTDIDKALDFYCNKLGLKEQFTIKDDKGNPHLIYLEVAPRQFVELFPGASGPYAQVDTAAQVHLCLEVEDIQKWYEEFKSRGGVPHGEPKFAMDNSWQFWTSDPDGNPIEFHQFTETSMQIVGNKE
jgi:catechol 2,3-dioxygenase-like lactoylglutathione lyase family enzyme